jgi:hypothetical protein
MTRWGTKHDTNMSCLLWLVKMDASHHLQLHSCTWFKITSIATIGQVGHVDANN